jgi:hypothetical protein
VDDIKPSPKIFALSLFCLAAFLAWQAFAVRNYIRAESRPPSWDQAIHLEIALDYREALQVGDWGKVMNLAPKPGMPPFPPLHHLLLKGIFSGPDPAGAALWLNWFYVAVLAISLFALAWHFRPDETAVLSVIIFCCSPAVQELLYTQLMDLALVACAAAAYWALVASNEFYYWAGSLFFGVIFGVGMLLKWSFFSYMLPAAYAALAALAYREKRWKVLVAAGVALLSCGYWYVLHFPTLIPRLFQATADFAVPFWRGGAAFTYLWLAADGLGPLLLVLSVIGLFAPQFRRYGHHGWMMVAWVVCAFVFWTVVPNRQIRFLLPGLPMLAVAGLGPWPKWLFWGLAAVQLFSAANFSTGWIDPIRLPLPWGTVRLFPTIPPAREDWKIADILAEAEKRHEPGTQFSNLTLVANDSRFNGPVFNWTSKLIGFPHVRVRGVNNRLCELSALVLVKGGSLGPDSVIGGLPEARQTIQDPKGWFAQAYEEARRWPLPDGYDAVLYQLKHPKTAPVARGKAHYQFYSAGPFEANDFDIELTRWNPARSVYGLVKASAAQMQLRGLVLTDLKAEMGDALFVPIYFGKSDQWSDLRLLKIGKLRLKSAKVSAEAIRAFLEKRVPGLKVSSLEIDKTARLRGRLGRLKISAELSAEILQDPPALRVRLLDARVGTTAVPEFLLKPFRSFTQPFVPTPDTPFLLDIPSLTFSDGVVSVP